MEGRLGERRLPEERMELETLFFSTQKVGNDAFKPSTIHQYLYSTTTKTHGDVADSSVTHAL
jgi:hypothetical protein